MISVKKINGFYQGGCEICGTKVRSMGTTRRYCNECKFEGLPKILLSSKEIQFKNLSPGVTLKNVLINQKKIQSQHSNPRNNQGQSLKIIW